MNLPAGHKLQKGKYKLIRVVGQGGFGITYKGFLTEIKGQLGSIRSEVPICIKEYFFKEYCFRNQGSFRIEVHSAMGRQLFDKFKEKLIKEARILSEVRHPNIVNVLDVFEENNTAYIAMEFIDGHSLKFTVEKEGAMTLEQAMKYVRQICEALHFIHAKNILHLDIKPSNILIDGRDNARLIDFGVSKRYDSGERETSATTLILSKGFAPIEQYDNDGMQTFSPCPDIYSLGATIYYLLTGKTPVESILRATRPFPRPKELNQHIPDNIEEVILKAMEINPGDRYQSVAEMMEALGFTPAGENVPADTRHDAGHDRDNSDTTLAYIPPQTQNANSGEPEQPDFQTAIKPWQQRQKDKKRNIILISVVLCVMAILGISLFSLMGKKPVDVVRPQPAAGTDSSIMKGDGNAPVDGEKKKTERRLLDPPVVNPVRPSAKDGETAMKPDTAAGQRDRDYQPLMTSAREKMEAGDFAGAYDDYYKAYRINPTEELYNLLSVSMAKKKEQQIAEKREQYEMKMPFGKLTIVRKKSSGKYGAIDEDGEEKIACKYRTSEAWRDGLRAFVRDDNLSDIYDSSGNMVNTNVAY
ncbi:MAG: protein kinase [Tannerellaceae bacterium]|jgi:serine/threonine-protein kinase|nr:protein kinase [Tannerellaceae bacterium]